MKTNGKDVLQIHIVYLDAGTESFSVSCVRCSKTRVSPVYTKTNTGLWKEIYVDVPNFKYRAQGYDFSIDFTGSTIIGMVDVLNKSK